LAHSNCESSDKFVAGFELFFVSFVDEVSAEKANQASFESEVVVPPAVDAKGSLLLAAKGSLPDVAEPKGSPDFVEADAKGSPLVVDENGSDLLDAKRSVVVPADANGSLDAFWDDVVAVEAKGSLVVVDEAKGSSDDVLVFIGAADAKGSSDFIPLDANGSFAAKGSLAKGSEEVLVVGSSPVGEVGPNTLLVLPNGSLLSDLDPSDWVDGKSILVVLDVENAPPPNGSNAPKGSAPPPAPVDAGVSLPLSELEDLKGSAVKGSLSPLMLFEVWKGSPAKGSSANETDLKGSDLNGSSELNGSVSLLVLKGQICF